MSNLTDKSLLRCTLLKSADVFLKLVLYASYVVCGVTAFVLTVCMVIAVTSVIADPIRIVITAMWDAVAFAGTFAAAIPWYAYVGIVIVAAIIGYSFSWCIVREFTEEDWKYGLDSKAGWLFVIPVFIALFICIYQNERYGYMKRYTSLKVLLTDVAFMFPGACLHYCKRMEGERK